MNIAIIHLIVTAAATTTANLPLERPEREDTIYVLHGDASELESFEETLGDWRGGELIEKNVEERAYTFWAYSERTASQARQFIMPAVLSGLEMEILEYDQEYAFPEKRAEADSIAIECGATRDPFFVKPTGAIQLLTDDELAEELRTCLETGLRSVEVNGTQSAIPPADVDADETS